MSIFDHDIGTEAETDESTRKGSYGVETMGAKESPRANGLQFSDSPACLFAAAAQQADGAVQESPFAYLLVNVNTSAA